MKEQPHKKIYWWCKFLYCSLESFMKFLVGLFLKIFFIGSNSFFAI